MKNRIFTLTILLPLRLAAQVAIPQFIIPIEGAYLQDYYLVNYVDWSFDSIQDYRCGHKTYDGHQGTDFVLRNFAQMDAGVNVYAAEAGVVTYLVDTLFDRNKTAVSGGLGNYVAIRHFNDFYTYYGHLKKTFRHGASRRYSGCGPKDRTGGQQRLHQLKLPCCHI